MVSMSESSGRRYTAEDSKFDGCRLYMAFRKAIYWEANANKISLFFLSGAERNGLTNIWASGTELRHDIHQPIQCFLNGNFTGRCTEGSAPDGL